MWTYSGAVMRLYSTTSSCPPNFIFAIFVGRDCNLPAPPDPHWLIFSISSLVSARVLSFFRNFDAVDISPASNDGGICFSFSPPLCLAPSLCPLWTGQELPTKDISTAAAFDFKTLGSVTFSLTLLFSFLNIDLYFLSPLLVFSQAGLA